MTIPSPLLTAYLDALPDGIRSYPDAVQKATVVRTFTQGVRIEPLLKVLPGELHELLKDPPPVTLWVPEVHATCLYLAMADQLFGGAEGLVEHAYKANRALLDSVFYRVLLTFVSPTRLLLASTSLWKQLHRGITLDADLLDASCRIRLAYPRALLPGPLVGCYATALRAPLELSGHQNVRAEVERVSDTEAVYRLEWE